MLFPLLQLVGLTLAQDQLVQIQVIYRHGDRTPLGCFPTDPNLPYWNQWLDGELTTNGMAQHYKQGVKLKNRYIDQLKFISSTYRREEVLAWASKTPRCIQSAEANFAGFYSASTSTHPNLSGCPSGWTPIPIHSREPPLDHMLDPSHDCPREDTLMTLRGSTNEKFIEYEAEHLPMIDEIAKKSGMGILDAPGLIHFYDCIRIEKEFYNMTLADWITPSLYEQMGKLYFRTGDYMHGQADFGEADDVELLRVRGGTFLTEIVTKMQQKINGTDSTKMIVYSTHDDTMTALWMTMGAKKGTVGDKNPDYAAMYVFELWKTSGGYVVKTMFAPNEFSPFVSSTQNIAGCGGGSSCSFETFQNRSTPYYVKHINELCDRI